MKRGMWYAVGAYGCWGILPVYWKWLHRVPALQLLSHRILWSLLALLVFILVTKRWKEFCVAALKPKVLRVYSGAAVLIGINWLTYVWAVNAGHIIETSLGYFINPLLSVLMGVIFLHEHLRRWQWIPIVMASAGVLYLTFAFGSLPWIALTLAFTFGTYGLVKKRAPLGSLYGLTLETGILMAPAFCFLIYSEKVGSGAFLHSGLLVDVILVGAGVVTTIPLLMFASAARRIPLSHMGILQYIAPILQFIVGVLIYSEPFTAAQFIGYSIVWIALVLFAVEGYVAYRSQPVMASADQSAPDIM